MVCYLPIETNGLLDLNFFFFLSLGRIEFEEFAEIVADSYFRKFTRAEILEAFSRFDRNHDGFIEADELKNILSQLGRNYSIEEVRQYLENLFPFNINAFRFIA
jgi:Ca2+-binding EF-hand superfamily protein